MRLFQCPDCGGVLFFSNLSCGCGSRVTFDPRAHQFTSRAIACDNRERIGCNWSREGSEYCRSCAMTAVYPDLNVAGNQERWSRAELAKRWVLAGLMRWSWFTDSDSGTRPEFHMLAEQTSDGPTAVVMGHQSGLITINLAEADAAERVRRREQLGEPYRTLVGHFRHELAHLFFERLAQSDEFLTGFRNLFGDESTDYGEALARYYATGAPPGWQDAHVTTYASAHPHEDWAESAAHILHLVDMVDSFSAAGLEGKELPLAGYDAYIESDTEQLTGHGMRLGIALNHVNRAMGLSDIYPFVNTSTVREKLGFAHRWLSTGARI